MKQIIKHGLAVYGFVNIFSAFMYVVIEQQKLGGDIERDRWTWFSRAALAIICFGMYAIIDAIEHKDKEESR